MEEGTRCREARCCLATGFPAASISMWHGAGPLQDGVEHASCSIPIPSRRALCFGRTNRSPAVPQFAADKHSLALSLLLPGALAPAALAIRQVLAGLDLPLRLLSLGAGAVCCFPVQSTCLSSVFLELHTAGGETAFVCSSTSRGEFRWKRRVNTGRKTNSTTTWGFQAAVRGSKPPCWSTSRHHTPSIGRSSRYGGCRDLKSSCLQEGNGGIQTGGWGQEVKAFRAVGHLSGGPPRAE